MENVDDRVLRLMFDVSRWGGRMNKGIFLFLLKQILISIERQLHTGEQTLKALGRNGEQLEVQEVEKEYVIDLKKTMKRHNVDFALVQSEINPKIYHFYFKCKENSQVKKGLETYLDKTVEKSEKLEVVDHAKALIEYSQQLINDGAKLTEQSEPQIGENLIELSSKIANLGEVLKNEGKTASGEELTGYAPVLSEYGNSLMKYGESLSENPLGEQLIVEGNKLKKQSEKIKAIGTQRRVREEKQDKKPQKSKVTNRIRSLTPKRESMER